MAQVQSEIPLMKNDFGQWADHYVSIPYDHYRAEVYQLFIDVFSHLEALRRVLDVGAGPGHLTYEFYRRYPESSCRFVLLDSSREMLRAAKLRFASRSAAVTTACRSYNIDGWAVGLGKFDAIVSNNSLFHLHPRNLKSFYCDCYERLKTNGVLLNQQAFGYESRNRPGVRDTFSEIVQVLPDDILPQDPSPMTDAAKQALKRRKIAAGERRVAAMKKALASGIRIIEADEYQYLTAEKHLEYMRSAGFSAGCIWQKRDFGVLMAIKGRPFATNGSV